MFHVFLDHPELGVSVSYDSDLVKRLQLYNDYCSLEVVTKPPLMFQAGVIDSYPLYKLEDILGRFSFSTGGDQYQATLGL